MQKLYKYFPMFKTWLSLHAFVGCISLIAGIFLASKFSPAYLTQLYNNYTLSAILLFLFFGLVSRKLKFRVLYFFFAGFLILSFHTGAEHKFYREVNKIITSSNSVTISGRLTSPPVLSNGIYTFFISSDMIYSSNDTLRGVNLPLIHC